MQDRNRHKLAQVTLVIGKGGVGKTSVASGLATAASKRVGRAILVEFMDGESGARALQRFEGSSEDKHEVLQVVIRPTQALEELTASLFHSALLAKVLTGNFAMKRLFRAAPALRELAQLEVIRELADRDPTVPVIVDMPATGHGLAWLRVSRQLETLLISGPLQAVAQRLSRKFLIPERCSIVLVTLPERLVLQETVELANAMKSEVGLDPTAIVVNRVPKQISDASLEEASRWSREPDPVGAAATKLIEVLEARREARNEATAQLAETSVDDRNPIMLPLFGTDPGAERVAAWLTESGLLDGVGSFQRGGRS